MPKLSFKEMERRDLELIHKLVNNPIKAIAVDFGLEPTAVRQWLFRIRERRRRFQGYLNRQNERMKRSARVRKLLLSSKIDKEEE